MRKKHPREAAKAARIARAREYKRMLTDYTLAEIGKMQIPPISSQRVGQLIASLKSK